MPTKSGKPRKNETLLDKQGKVIGVITEVDRRKVYSVTINKPGSKFPTQITDFAFWAKRHDWTFR